MKRITISFAFLLCVVAYPHSGNAKTYNACVLRKTGTVRLVSDLSSCERWEAAISWNSEGPPGPAGPIGPLPVVQQVSQASDRVYVMHENTAAVILQLDLAPGNYLVMAKATVGILKVDLFFDTGDRQVYCALTVGSAADESMVASDTGMDDAISLLLPVTLTAANQAYLICFPQDAIGFVWYPRIVALPIGGVTSQ